MPTYMPSLARAWKDLMSLILTPGGPLPSIGRLVEVLSKVADKAFGGYYHGIVGLIEVTVILLGPPAHKYPNEAGRSNLPGAYQPEWVEHGSTIRVLHDSSDNGEHLGTLAEAQSTRIVGNCAGLISTGVGWSSVRTSRGSLGLGVKAERIPDSGAGNPPGLGVVHEDPALIEPAHPMIDRDSSAGLAIDSIAVVAAPFFSWKARPSRQRRVQQNSDEGRRVKDMAVKAEAAPFAIDHPGEKDRTRDRPDCKRQSPLHTITSCGRPQWCPTNPDHQCGMRTHEVDRAGVVEQSAFRPGLSKLKTFRLKPSRSIFHGQSHSPAGRATPASLGKLPPLVGPCDRVMPVPPRIEFVYTPVNEDIPAAPGFSPDGNLKRRNRVTPQGRTPVLAHDEQLELSSDSCPSSPVSSNFSTVAPSTPTDASSVWPDGKHRGTGAVRPELYSRSIDNYVEDDVVSPCSSLDDDDKDNFAAYFSEDDEVISPLYERVYASLCH